MSYIFLVPMNFSDSTMIPADAMHGKIVFRKKSSILGMMSSAGFERHNYWDRYSLTLTAKLSLS